MVERHASIMHRGLCYHSQRASRRLQQVLNDIEARR